MRKINEQTLNEASDRLYQAVAVLDSFDCYGLHCDSCPLQYRGRCAASILDEMRTQAVKRAQEAKNDNH